MQSTTIEPRSTVNSWRMRDRSTKNWPVHLNEKRSTERIPRSCTMGKIEILRQADLFRNLPDDLLRKIAGLAITRHLERGQILFSEHEMASGLYVVGSGELRSIRQSANGREQVLSTERAGAVLAAVPVLTDGKFFSTVIADTRADVLSTEKRHFWIRIAFHRRSHP